MDSASLSTSRPCACCSQTLTAEVLQTGNCSQQWDFLCLDFGAVDSNSGRYSTMTRVFFQCSMSNVKMSSNSRAEHTECTVLLILANLMTQPQTGLLLCRSLIIIAGYALSTAFSWPRKFSSLCRYLKQNLAAQFKCLHWHK